MVDCAVERSIALEKDRGDFLVKRSVVFEEVVDGVVVGFYYG